MAAPWTRLMAPSADGSASHYTLGAVSGALEYYASGTGEGPGSPGSTAKAAPWQQLIGQRPRLRSPPSHLTQPRHSPPDAGQTGAGTHGPGGGGHAPYAHTLLAARSPGTAAAAQSTGSAVPQPLDGVGTEVEQLGLGGPGRVLSPRSGGPEASDRLAIMSMRLNDRYAAAMSAIRMYDAAMTEYQRREAAKEAGQLSATPADDREWDSALHKSHDKANTALRLYQVTLQEYRQLKESIGDASGASRRSPPPGNGALEGTAGSLTSETLLHYLPNSHNGSAHAARWSQATSPVSPRDPPQQLGLQQAQALKQSATRHKRVSSPRSPAQGQSKPALQGSWHAQQDQNRASGRQSPPRVHFREDPAGDERPEAELATRGKPSDQSPESPSQEAATHYKEQGGAGGGASFDGAGADGALLQARTGADNGRAGAGVVGEGRRRVQLLDPSLLGRAHLFDSHLSPSAAVPAAGSAASPQRADNGPSVVASAPGSKDQGELAAAEQEERREERRKATQAIAVQATQAARAAEESLFQAISSPWLPGLPASATAPPVTSSALLFAPVLQGNATNGTARKEDSGCDLSQIVSHMDSMTQAAQRSSHTAAAKKEAQQADQRMAGRPTLPSPRTSPTSEVAAVARPPPAQQYRDQRQAQPKVQENGGQRPPLPTLSPQKTGLVSAGRAAEEIDEAAGGASEEEASGVRAPAVAREEVLDSGGGKASTARAVVPAPGTLQPLPGSGVPQSLNASGALQSQSGAPVALDASLALDTAVLLPQPAAATATSESRDSPTVASDTLAWLSLHFDSPIAPTCTPNQTPTHAPSQTLKWGASDRAGGAAQGRGGGVPTPPVSPLPLLSKPVAEAPSTPPVLSLPALGDDSPAQLPRASDATPPPSTPNGPVAAAGPAADTCADGIATNHDTNAVRHDATAAAPDTSPTVKDPQVPRDTEPPSSAALVSPRAKAEVADTNPAVKDLKARHNTGAPVLAAPASPRADAPASSPSKRLPSEPSTPQGAGQEGEHTIGSQARRLPSEPSTSPGAGQAGEHQVGQVAAPARDNVPVGGDGDGDGKVRDARHASQAGRGNGVHEGDGGGGGGGGSEGRGGEQVAGAGTSIGAASLLPEALEEVISLQERRRRLVEKMGLAGTAVGSGAGAGKAAGAAAKAGAGGQAAAAPGAGAGVAVGGASEDGEAVKDAVGDTGKNLARLAQQDDDDASPLPFDDTLPLPLPPALAAKPPRTRSPTFFPPAPGSAGNELDSVYKRIAPLGLARGADGGDQSGGGGEQGGRHGADVADASALDSDSYVGIRSQIQEQKQLEIKSAMLEEQARIQKLKARGFSGWS